MFTEILFLSVLLLISFLYSSVGHGGASGYLALMALWAVSTQEMRTSALTMNVLVASISFYHFYKAGYFNTKLFIPFAITSIPFSYLGGLITLDALLYKRILAICLVIAIYRLLYPNQNPTVLKSINWVLALFIGALIGVLSGMIGIGGGIILSPLLLLLRWATVKQAAAVSALFIVVNSISGLLAIPQMQLPVNFPLWIMAITIGSVLGGLYGANRFSSKRITSVLIVVLMFACVKLISL